MSGGAPPRSRAVSGRRLASAALPVAAIVVFAGFALAVVASAGSTLGFDYAAYDDAARRFLAGERVYDVSYEAAGGFGLFYYPPTFVPFVLPLTLVPVGLAIAVWTVALIVAFVIGTTILPVRRDVRWATLLLGGLMWPLLYAIKLGQVGPLLFLLFAAGWRSLADDVVTGITAGLGAAIKVQPGLLVLWALAAGRRRAAAAAVVTLVVLAAVVTLPTGLGVWVDFIDLLRRVSDPIATPHNFTPGAIAYRLGADRGVASAIELLTVGSTLVGVLYAALRRPPDRSFLVAVVGSQLVSPILWDHYALLLLLPVAFGLDRGQPWLAAVPLALSLPLVGVTPDIVYPVAFLACFLALLWRAPEARPVAWAASP